MPSKNKGRKPSKPKSNASKSLPHVSSSSARPAMSIPGRPRILVLALMDEYWQEGIYEHLMESVRAVASLTRVASAAKAKTILSSSLPPSSVLVVDAGITDPKYSGLLSQLVSYAKSGGTVVVGCNFPNNVLYDRVEPFFKTWDTQWKRGSYFRTTVYLNSGFNVPGMKTAGLKESYSVKAQNLIGVDRSSSVYNPSSSSRIESHVFEAMPVDTSETPAAYTTVGKGYLGFAGDVNAEEHTTKIIMAMLHLPIDKMEKDTRDKPAGIRRMPDGTFQSVMQSEKDREEQSGASSEPIVYSDYISIPQGNFVGTSKPQPAQNAAILDPPRERRPLEDEVERRTRRRSKRVQEKKRKAESLKNQGNDKFRAGDFKAAAELYKRAAKTYKPLPVYMSNLAACLLKLDSYKEAKFAATSAVIGDSSMVKAHFRRGLARKKLGNLTGAVRDFERCLQRDPGCTDARNELKVLDDVLDGYADNWDTDSGECDTDDPACEEISAFRVPGAAASNFLECASDTEEYRHVGNGIPCRYYNRNGCRFGASCRYKHAADKMSIRDELGRNVCSHYCIGRCHFRDEVCYYAHDTDYLHEKGWWNNPSAIITYQQIYDMEHSSGKKDVLKSWLGEEMNGTTMPWEHLDVPRKDAYKLHLELMDSDGDGFDFDFDSDEEDWDGPSYGPGKKGKGKQKESRSKRMKKEMEEGAENYGFTRSEVDELLCQGVKPWDEDAWAVLDVLNGGF